jgi:hypothetical protein
MNSRFQTNARLLSFLLLFVLLFAPFAGSIPAYAAPPLQSGVQRIRFAPGATSGVVGGNLDAGQVARYVLTALAGQTMTVQPFADGAPVFVTLFDTSRVVMGSTVSGEQWTGRLPATGDYSLMVFPSPYAGSVNYQLRVEITNRPQVPIPVAERIRFETGAVSAQVEGFLPSASTKVYVLGAAAGQIMSIESWTNSGPFRFTVTSANGTTLGSGNQGERWSGVLPRTEDYRITLQSPNDAPAAHYGLVVTVVNAAPAPTPTPVPPAAAERIRFPRGATSVTLTGYVDLYTPARYVLRALRGQTMTVDLSTLYGNATRVTVRDANGNFLGSANTDERWSGYLPATGDYYVEVEARPENVGDHFSLWIHIR